MRNWCDYGLALALGSCFLSAQSVSYSASDDAGDRKDGVSQVAERLKLDRRQMSEPYRFLRSPVCLSHDASV
jgi:hypothetical protein